MKKKLLVLLGAGSSVEQGMPKVECLNSLVRTWAKTWASRENRPDYFGAVWSNREQYVALHTDHRSYLEPNYERCLGDLHLLLNVAANVHDPLLGLIRHSNFFANFQRSPDLFQAIYGQFSELIKMLAQDFRERCLAFETGDKCERFCAYTQLFMSLSAKFDLGVYNLNHDSVASKTLSDFFTGFDANGIFQPSGVHSRLEWNFVYPLHGSVYFDLQDASLGEHSKKAEAGQVHPLQFPVPWIRWNNNLNARPRTVASDTTLIGARQSNDFRNVVVTTLVAGGWKLDQVQVEPFQTYYSTLVRHIHEADAILIGGYGFGDEHVNSVLSNSLRSRGTTRPRIVVLGYRALSSESSDDAAEQKAAQDHDTWISFLKKTLYCDSDLSDCRADFPLTDDQNRWELMVRAGATPNEQAVAVWTGGFCSAVDHIGKIADWLEQK